MESPAGNTQAERSFASEPLSTVTAGRRRTDARERDVGSRQYGEQEHLSKGQPCLAFASGEQAPGDLGRGEHGQISFSLSYGFMRTQY